MPRSKLLLLGLTFACLGSGALGEQQAVQQERETIWLTNPPVGSSMTVPKNAVIAEGFAATVIEHDDAAMILDEKTLRFGRRTEFTLDAGTVLLPDRGRWFCTYGPPRKVAQRFNIHICLRDRDRDGLFDQSKIQGTTRSAPMKPKVRYNELESWVEYAPTDGMKRILIFAGYKDDTVRLRDIEFLESSNDPESARTIEIPLPHGEGEISLAGVTINVLSVDANTTTIVRTGGELTVSPP